MKNITINDLVNILKTYNEEAIPDVQRAYYLADYLHRGQVRESGEEYISHPLNVAYILATINADCDTLCAALLHDTIEDTDISKEKIEEMFNSQVATLVDGVTKLAKMNFSNKEEMNLYNTRKIITSLMEDVRIIVIKLADRLHNMRTLEYKKSDKQIENSLETLEIFVPLANYIGAYEIKNELEDLSFKYIKPIEYQMINETRNEVIESSKKIVEDMMNKIRTILLWKKIPNQIKVGYKSRYQIYKSLENGIKLENMDDILSLDICVKDIDQCYLTLGIIHLNYDYVSNKIRDYVGKPKSNKYQSIHTSVYSADKRLIQIHIRTFEIDKIDSYGLTAYWYFNKGYARYVMQKKLKNEFQFYKSLEEINENFNDNSEFISQVKEEILSENIYVYTSSGKMIELPLGSSIIDYAYKMDSDKASLLVDAFVNDRLVELGYRVKDGDKVDLIFSEFSVGPKEEWLDFVKTSFARRKIKEYRKIENR